MGFLNNIFKAFTTKPESPQKQNQEHEPPKRYTPEEFVILEQEEAGTVWHGVPISELSKVAQQTYRGKYVKVDQYEYLVFYYSSNSRKTSLTAQCTLDENGLMIRTPHGYYPGQWTDSADEFVEKANQLFVFR